LLIMASTMGWLGVPPSNKTNIGLVERIKFRKG
jgi:hypothetical protein